jgi:hypothetical protein
LSPKQRKDPQDEGGGPHRVLLPNLPAKNLTAFLGGPSSTLDPAPWHRRGDHDRGHRATPGHKLVEQSLQVVYGCQDSFHHVAVCARGAVSLEHLDYQSLELLVVRAGHLDPHRKPRAAGRPSRNLPGRDSR